MGKKGGGEQRASFELELELKMSGHVDAASIHRLEGYMRGARSETISNFE